MIDNDVKLTDLYKKIELYRKINHDVLQEIHFQDKKWGVQNHDFPTWAVILGEEFGEACQEILNLRILDTTEIVNVLKNLDNELVQIIAVAMRIVEKIRTLNVNS